MPPLPGSLPTLNCPFTLSPHRAVLSILDSCRRANPRAPLYGLPPPSWLCPLPQSSRPLGSDTGLRAVVPLWILSTGHSLEASQAPALSALSLQLLAGSLQPLATPPNPGASASSSVKGRSKMPTAGLWSPPRPAWSPPGRWVHRVGEAKGVRAVRGGLRDRVDGAGLPASVSWANQRVRPTVPRHAANALPSGQTTPRNVIPIFR